MHSPCGPCTAQGAACGLLLFLGGVTEDEVVIFNILIFVGVLLIHSSFSRVVKELSFKAEDPGFGTLFANCVYKNWQNYYLLYF